MLLVLGILTALFWNVTPPSSLVQPNGDGGGPCESQVKARIRTAARMAGGIIEASKPDGKASTVGSEAARGRGNSGMLAQVRRRLDAYGKDRDRDRNSVARKNHR